MLSSHTSRFRRVQYSNLLDIKGNLGTVHFTMNSTMKKLSVKMKKKAEMVGLTKEG